MLAEIKDTYDSQNGGSYMSLFRRLCAVDLLHLDDLRQQIGPRTVSRLLEICDEPLPLMGPDLRLSSAG